MAARDRRVKFTNEILQGIMIVKLFGWEPALLKQLKAKRDHELVAVRNNMLMSGIMSFTFTALPLIVTAATFVIYAALGNQITASTAFPALSLLMLLREPLQRYPRVLITVLVDGQTAVERIGKFLQEAG